MAKKFLTTEQKRFIHENYLTVPIREMSLQFGTSKQPIDTYMRKNNLKLTEEIKQQRRKLSTGKVPPNKGMKGVHHPGSEKAWFKKGQKAHNARNDGDVSIRKDKSGKPYVFIRIAPNLWIHEHRLVWIKHNGPVPEGYLIRHLNNDSTDNRIENLAVITKYENRVLNNETVRQTDEYIARMLATRIRKVDKELQQYFLQFPELLNTKRSLINLKKLCKTLETQTK